MFPTNYFESRAEFRAAAERANARLESHPLANRGPRGEELSVDSARLGAARPRSLLVLTTGIHGIEAPAGSALLRLWLTEHAARLPADVGVLLVHALNPWGFAHGRRVNEHNVDLNRNALETFPGPVNPDYARIDAWLNPTTPSDNGEHFWPGALRYSWQLGLRALRQAIASGQYAHPRGLFYGGERREAALEIFTRLLSDPSYSAIARVLHVDIHTGLGRRGEYALLLADPMHTPGFDYFVRHFGNTHVRSNAPSGFTHYAARGTIGTVTARALPHARVRACTLEFGTYPALHVLRALRTENRLYHYGGSDPERAARVRAAFMETFCPNDPAWRAALLQSGRRVFDSLPAALADAS